MFTRYDVDGDKALSQAERETMKSDLHQENVNNYIFNGFE